MEYRTLGRTGLKVSRLGFGGIPIQRTTQQVANEMFAVCRDIGVNFIDTARGYGDSEEKIGKAIEGYRQSFYLASKSPRRDADGFTQDLETCLRLLKTDYVDLYQLHMVSSMEVWEQCIASKGALEAALRAKEKGLIRHIGITSHNNEVLKHMLRTNAFDTAQFPLNVVESQFKESMDLAHDLNMGTIAMKPLAGGSFARADLALRYLVTSDVTTIIPGMDTVEQIHENYRAMMQGELSEAELEELLTDARALGDAFCRRCEYCLPCPANIRIPSVFILEGYVSRYGLIDWARERYWGLPAQADACSECGLCEERCPYKLPIREKMKQAAASFQKIGR